MRALDARHESRTEAFATALLVFGSVALVVAGIVCARWMLRPIHDDKWRLVDLDVYRAAGNALAHGHSIYGGAVRRQLHIPLPFIYPPFAAVLAVPFAAMSSVVARWVWTIVTVALLATVVRVCAAPLLERFGRAAPAAWLLALGVAGALTPVEDHLRFGQVGIPLMACCVLDCALRRTRWPRGMLVGVAAAVKLVPAIFVPYLWLSGRRRAASVATVTFFACSFVGLIAAPGDSWTFWTDKVFQPTSPAFFSNQSLEGMLRRGAGAAWHVAWLPLVAIVLVYGMRRAVAASRAGDEIRGIAITGLVSVLVSPISWIHHLVWVVPVIAVIAGDGRDVRRIVLAFAVAGLFVARLPYVGYIYVTGHPGRLLEDAYGLLAIALLLALSVPVVRRPAKADAISG